MTLNVGIIGLGVGEKHIEGYEKNNSCKVVAICDKDEKKLREVSDRYPSKNSLRNPDKILFDPTIDVVSIATYDNSHCDLIEKAIKNRKHIFVEKPLCLNKNEYEIICKLLLNNNNLNLSSNLILRKTPRFISLKDKIDKGVLGLPYYIEGDYDYGRINKILEGWRGQIPNYSVMHGGGIHLIDLISWILSKKVQEVFAFGTNIATASTNFRGNDMVAALLKFDGGVIAKVSANFACVTPHFHRLSVYGTKATFQQSHGATVFINSRDPKIPHENIFDEYPGSHKGDLIPSFIDSIIKGKKSDIGKQEVCDVMAISLAIEESLKIGSKIKVEYNKV